MRVCRNIKIKLNCNNFNHGKSTHMTKTNSRGILIASCGNLNISVKNKVDGNDGRFLILEATIYVSDYLLINLYNTNTEKVQLTTITNLNNLLKDFEDFHDKKEIFAGDFNLMFDKNLESAGGVPFSKNLVYPRSLN